MRGAGRLALAVVSLAIAPGHGVPQDGPAERPVTLAEAVADAVRRSPGVAAARARAEAARQGRRASDATRWPTLGADAGAVTSTDPVAAFGGRLRQGRFRQDDFSLDRLNHPDPFTDWSVGLGAEWTPVDLAAGAGRAAAAHEAEAAGLGARWTARTAGYRAEVRYFEAVAAFAAHEAALASLESAEATLALVARRRDEGLVTDADALRASAAVEEGRAGVVGAEAALADARERLAVALGWPAGLTPVPVDTLFPERPASGGVRLEARPDLRASALAAEAAGDRARQAGRLRLPTLHGFAVGRTHAPRVAEGVEDEWTVGFQVRVPVFTGRLLSARGAQAQALREAERHEHGARLREAEARLAEARRGVDAAERSAAAAAAAASAAGEAAHRMRLRFGEGLSTPADLLGAEAHAARLRATAVAAELARRVAAARLAFLTDTDTDTSARLAGLAAHGVVR